MPSSGPTRMRRAQLVTSLSFTIEALRKLPVKSAYLDSELCAVPPDGVPVFTHLPAAMDEVDRRHPDPGHTPPTSYCWRLSSPRAWAHRSCTSF